MDNSSELKDVEMRIKKLETAAHTFLETFSEEMSGSSRNSLDSRMERVIQNVEMARNRLGNPEELSNQEIKEAAEIVEEADRGMVKIMEEVLESETNAIAQELRDLVN
jgi:uncharacterized protein YfkK (UPF0435 family)